LKKKRGFWNTREKGRDLNSFLRSEFYAGTSEKFPKAEF
jgi:hypothetical protein